MHDFLLITLFISIVGLFIECWIVMRYLKTQLHAYLLLCCIATLVNISGGLLKLLSKTEEAFITAQQLSYLGRVWIGFALLMFTAELCHVRMPALLHRTLAAIHIAIFMVILTLRYHDLYYSSYTFETGKMFPVLRCENGIVHHFFMQLQIIYLVAAVYWLFRALSREKRPSAKKRILIIIFTVAAEGIFYIIQIFHLLKVTYEFDVVMLGNVLGNLFMFIAIFRYNLLGIIDIAREIVIDRLSEGVIAVDINDRVQYFNEPALRLCPRLGDDPAEALRDIKEAVSRGDTITLGDRIYSPEENDLTDEGESFGKLYVLVDTTVIKQNELKLKADAEILEMAAKSMTERLSTAEELMRQDRAMRHDRRHFEALLLSLIQDGKTEEAKKCLEERLSQEPRTAVRYCENTTVNAAITHYISVAERNNIKVKVSANIPFDPGVDEMQLAIAVSNLLENAIHACEKVPEKDRYIEMKAKYKDQLLLEIVNSCEGKVPLDDEGHPFSTEWDHGIGTRSVLAFVDSTDSEIRYIAEEHVFKVRMVI